ncbi:toll/interleukin-1 receptor domain-containing protein [Segetibacter sp. 3557_3]|uniref:toll/interleukin-1 receptor domain-containing protein n=1 Tax=Segetibacter sp. 3557_3 TaxID=2547429 RepID=UPI001058FA66|nr:toll/interleukin-1 receptor domain-containing protein [Segetibacter sp. 3557_3]TDH18162.1 toll/interleukin-1 receptor domain-containing protein [Segetibacter sp. 3557_3]
MIEQDIFLSYSRSDKEFVFKLFSDLKEAGAGVWLDSKDIPGGSTWDSEVQKALISCKYLIIVLSPSSVASPNVLDEVYYALEKDKKIIPVILSVCEIPFRIKRLQHIDLSIDYSTGFIQLLSDLSIKVKPQSSTHQEASKEEQILWDWVRRENTLAKYKIYMQRYPKGKFIAEAFNFGYHIKERPKDESPDFEKEKFLWEKARKENTIESHEEYLDNTILGSHWKKAENLITRYRGIHHEIFEWYKVRRYFTMRGVKYKYNKFFEQWLWMKTKRENTESAYRNYLSHYHFGDHAEEAWTALEKVIYFSTIYD